MQALSSLKNVFLDSHLDQFLPVLHCRMDFAREIPPHTSSLVLLHKLASAVDNGEVLHFSNFLHGMLRSWPCIWCEFQKLTPKQSLKGSIKMKSDQKSVDCFRKEGDSSRLCTPTHTGHRDWFGCPGVTAATELLNIR